MENGLNEFAGLVRMTLEEMVLDLPEMLQGKEARLDGELIDGKANGIVTLSFVGGDVELYCKDGIPSEVIKITFTNGCVYEGIFPEGAGRILFPNGSMYSGLLKDCLMHGKGNFYEDRGAIVPRIEATWHEGRSSDATLYEEE